MGLASWLGRISKEDAVLVSMLRKAGAVIYASKISVGFHCATLLTTRRDECADDFDDAGDCQPVRHNDRGIYQRF